VQPKPLDLSGSARSAGIDGLSVQWSIASLPVSVRLRHRLPGSKEVDRRAPQSPRSLKGQNEPCHSLRRHWRLYLSKRTSGAGGRHVRVGPIADDPQLASVPELSYPSCPGTHSRSPMEIPAAWRQLF
jgi:hypothetical protein